MTALLSVGIIGCGDISKAYLTLSKAFRNIQVRAVADLVPEVAAAQAKKFGVAALSVQDLLADPSIDVVVNLTTPAAHFAVTRSILEAGKHAYSEKPLVLSLEEGERLRELAEAGNLRIGSAPDTFLGGAHQQARAEIDGGGIGKVIAGSANVMSHGMEHWHPAPDFFFQPGAGPMLDVGPYYITNLVQLIGPVRRVAALASTPSPTRTVLSEPRRGEVIRVRTPTNIHALLEFISGATVPISTSWDVWAHRHAPMELYGTEGSLFVPDPNWFGGELEKAGKDRVISRVEPWDHPFGRINQQHRTAGPKANYRTAGLAEMAQAIAEGRPHRCSLELAIHAVEVMTGVLRSGEEGRFVEMTTTCQRPAALSPADAAALLTDEAADVVFA